ncbi:MAG: TlpA family protein disulfide reductase [Planctomycetaceae bacterium]
MPESSAAAGKKKRKKAGQRAGKRKRAGKKPAPRRKRKRKAARKKRPRKRPPRKTKRPPRRKPADRKRAATKAAKRKTDASDKGRNAADGKTVRTQIRDWKGTQKLIARHKGKVVVVDFWATWCKPCVKELPELVALQKRFPKDVVTISYNADNDGTENIAKEVVPRVLKVLKRLKAARVINVVSRQTDEETYEAVGIDSVPTIFVYGRDGKLAKKIDVNSAGGKDVSYQTHVLPVVKKLIEQK